MGLLIFVHELGHFLVAKFFKVHIESFAIGFGPSIISFKKKETIYKLSLIPLGGYVKMYDKETNDDSDKLQHSFHNKKWWKKILIVSGGPIFNMLFALLLIIITFAVGRTYSDVSPIIDSAVYPYDEFFQKGDRILQVNNMNIRSWSDIFSSIVENDDNVFIFERKPDVKDSKIHQITSADSITISLFIENYLSFYESLTPKTSNIIGEVNPGMPAWKAGLQAGDRILMIDGVNTENWSDVREGITNSKNDSIVLTIENNSSDSNIDASLRIRDVVVYPEINHLLGQNTKIIGISQHLDLTFTEEYSIYEAIKYGLMTTASFVYFNYNSLFILLKNPTTLKNNIGGPIMVYYMTSQTSQRGFSELLLFMAAISILLMIMNLLPIPVFDGGHIIFFLYEGIFSKPIPMKTRIVLQHIGFLILVVLILFTFYSDLSKFFLRIM